VITQKPASKFVRADAACSLRQWTYKPVDAMSGRQHCRAATSCGTILRRKRSWVA
jgi:hypothetical protein